MSKSTDPDKYTSLDVEEDNGQEQSEMFKQDIEIGSELEDNVKDLIEENESLRKGMHEILDSIHNQDGNVQITNLSLAGRIIICLNTKHTNLLNTLRAVTKKRFWKGWGEK